MPRRKHKPEEIIKHLRAVEIHRAEGKSLAEAAKSVGVCAQTVIRWQKEYGGLEVDQLKRLKDLELENQRLKRLVANQALDLSILQEVNKGNF